MTRTTSFAFLVLFALVGILALGGCGGPAADARLNKAEAAAVNAADCAVAATLTCTAAAVRSCQPPALDASDQAWTGYATCLGTIAADCGAAQVATCGFAAVVEYTGAAPPPGGASGVDRDQVGGCIQRGPCAAAEGRSSHRCAWTVRSCLEEHLPYGGG